MSGTDWQYLGSTVAILNEAPEMKRPTNLRDSWAFLVCALLDLNQ